MAIDPDRLLNFQFPAVEQTYGTRDVILYALGLGYGSHPLDRRELAFVYEKTLQVLPTFPLALGFTSLRHFDLGINYSKVVHSAQQLHLHAPIPTEDTVVCETCISDVWDLGEARGAILRVRRRITSRRTGALIATTDMDALCRADGGFGGVPAPQRTRPSADAEPDLQVLVPTLPQQALLYRLCGDWNVLHADPAVASAAGFNAPILHGLATFGIAVNRLMGAISGGAGSLRSVSGRFTAPFYPGETLLVKSWRTDHGCRFQAVAQERAVVVVDNGECVVD